jgi:hypothetical protein
MRTLAWRTRTERQSGPMTTWRRLAAAVIVAELLMICGLASAAVDGQVSETQPPKLVSASPMLGAAGEFQASFPAYRVRLRGTTELGPVPALEIYRNEQLVFRFPLVAGLDSAASREHLSGIQYQVHALEAGKPGALYEIAATAASSLWARREFHWRFYADHLEFDQVAWGEGKLGRCYFFSNGSRDAGTKEPVMGQLGTQR